MARYRAGIVGFGGMGQRHLKAYEGTDCEVVAICEFAPERVFEKLPAFPKDRVYRDCAELLEKERLDILSVASNGPTHSEITMEAVRKGVPRVYCEKPLATSLAAADELREAVRRSGARVTVNHVRRWNADYERIKEMLREGAIGDLRHIYFQSGSTGLGNFVIHAFDLMRYLSGSEASWVIGRLDRTGTPNPRGVRFRDPAGYGMLEFKNGMRGFVDSSEDTGVQYLFVLAGVYGRMIIDELNGVWEIRARSQEKRALPLTRYGEPMDPVPFSARPYEIVDMTRGGIRNLLSDEPLRCTVEDGVRSLEMIMAFHESDERGNVRVELPLREEARGRVVEIA